MIQCSLGLFTLNCGCLATIVADAIMHSQLFRKFKPKFKKTLKPRFSLQRLLFTAFTQLVTHVFMCLSEFCHYSVF